MECNNCRSANDADALYCVNCGKPLAMGDLEPGPKPRRNWWYLLLLVPVLAFAGGIGYYKFYLPQGMAAVVNGEGIALAEVDAAARELAEGKDLTDEARSRMRRFHRFMKCCPGSCLKL